MQKDVSLLRTNNPSKKACPTCNLAILKQSTVELWLECSVHCSTFLINNVCKAWIPKGSISVKDEQPVWTTPTQSWNEQPTQPTQTTPTQTQIVDALNASTDLSSSQQYNPSGVQPSGFAPTAASIPKHPLS